MNEYEKLFKSELRKSAMISGGGAGGIVSAGANKQEMAPKQRVSPAAPSAAKPAVAAAPAKPAAPIAGGIVSAGANKQDNGPTQRVSPAHTVAAKSQYVEWVTGQDDEIVRMIEAGQTGQGATVVQPIDKNWRRR